jgi:hypothetical protein
MTELTPAVDRAAKESFRAGAENAARLIGLDEPVKWSILSAEDQEHVRIQARAAVSAALHDPDDPDALAGYVREHTPSGLRCDCGRDLVDAADWARHVADAVRAEILGGDA